MSKEVFKKIPVAMRDHLSELSGSELKVWMYLYLRSGADSTSFPSNQTIADDIGMHLNSVKTAKKGLRDKGYSSRVTQRLRDDGAFSTVVEKLCLPWHKYCATEVQKVDHGTVVQKHRRRVFVPTEVDTEKQNQEVAATPIQANLEGQSELVSESVSEYPATPDQSPTPDKLLSVADINELEKTQSILSEESALILNQLYPMGVQPTLLVPVDKLNYTAEFLFAEDWKSFFRWNRTHKPGNLVFRSLEKFIEGATYALNDFANHQADGGELCGVCRKASKGAKAS